MFFRQAYLTMALLRYKLPKQAAAAMPLDGTCSIQAAKQFIEAEHCITSAFKLRVCVGGGMRYLKPSQTLAEVAALGTDVVISVNFYDDVAKKLARRQLANETAALVGTHVQADGDKTRVQIRSSLDEVKDCIRHEVKKLTFGAKNPGGDKRGKRRLVGATVVAAQQPDSEMGDSIFEVCHVETQTWADGEKHTVCIIKAEGKPSLSRELSTLTTHDPFISRDAAQPVRVVVIPHDVEHPQFFVGWRGVVQAAAASAPSVKVNFPLLKMGKIVHVSMMVPRTALFVLGDDDVSMLPNTYPWLGRRVTTVQTGQTGEIVDVSSRGRVRVALEGLEKKKTAVFIESKGSSFEALFTEEPRAEEAPVLPDPPQATEAQPQAAPSQPLVAEAPPHVEHRGVVSVADSDAESDHPASARHGSDEEEEEPLAPKRRGINPTKAAVVKKSPAAGSAEGTKPVPMRRTGKQPVRATVVKAPAAGSDEEPKPAPKRKGKESARAAPKRRRKPSFDVD